MRLILFVAFLTISRAEKVESDVDEQSIGQLELLKTDLKEDQVALASSYPSQKYFPAIRGKADTWKPPIEFGQYNPINNNFQFPQGFPSGFPSGLPSGFPSGLPSGLPSGKPGLPSGKPGLPSGSGFPSFSENNVFGSVNNIWKPKDEALEDYVHSSTAAPQNNYGSQSNYNPPQNNYQKPQSDYVPGQNYAPAPAPPQNNYYIPPSNSYYTTTQRPTTAQVAIIKNEHIMGDNGNYKYEYQIADGTHVGEEGYVTNPNTDSESIVKKGWYSYVGADGVRYTVKYWADASGFHAEGDHLPKPPPIPPAIQASIEQNEREEAEKNKHQQGNRPQPPQHHYTTTPSPPSYYPTTQPTYPQHPPQQTYYPQQQQTYYPQQQQNYYPQQQQNYNPQQQQTYYPQQQQTYYPQQQQTQSAYPSYSRTN